MAKIYPKSLAQQLLDTDLAVVYTVPAGFQVIIKEFVLCNTTSDVAKASLHLVKPNGSPERANAFVYDMEMKAHESKAFGLTTVLDAPGWTIQAVSDTLEAVSLHASGVEVDLQTR